MNKKIIFFDIDRTLFNPDSFLDELFGILNSKFGIEENKLRDEYIKSKSKKYFDPVIFLQNISSTFNINLEELEKIFWDQDLIDKHLFQDSSIIETISKKAKIGIFSKGDWDFQSRKISTFNKYISKEDIYIYKEKKDKIGKIVEKYKKSEMYFIDDNLEILIEIRKARFGVITILIDRRKKYIENDKINACIQSLEELTSIL